MHGEQLGGDSEYVFFGFIRIGHVAGEENIRGAGHIGDASGQRTARARFRGGQREVLVTQQADDGSLEGFSFRVNPLAENRADFGFDLGKQAGCSDQPEVHFGRSRAIADFEVAARFELLSNAFLDLALSDAGQPVDATFAPGRCR